MRHLTRARTRAQLLLERSKIIAIAGPTTSERAHATVGYLRKVGYDLPTVGDVSLADVPGPIDLVLVFGPADDAPRLVQEAAAKRVDGIWFADQVPSRAASSLARQAKLTLVAGEDIVRRHRERQSSAGQPPKLTARSRRRGRARPITADPSLDSGWDEAGGGGSQGGGGGRSAIDEKKMA